MNWIDITMVGSLYEEQVRKDEHIFRHRLINDGHSGQWHDGRAPYNPQHHYHQHLPEITTQSNKHS
ncbi:hypothetical protein ATL17_1589 [Maritalea mobilis]|uniref:Uncharacterized protein n=1 Tax=Maritalea mobilis TaxID=483324 RepID=A0A4R6VN18_9HYPH|nr:hypothetical protein ATL17_1589 [Maritalea mobilis]